MAAESTDSSTVRTVVCSPHFDDAVLDCWTVLAREPGSVVVNVFSGAPDGTFTTWWDAHNGASSSAEHVAERVAEDRAALELAGTTPIDLGVLESQYRLRRWKWLHALFRRSPHIRFVLLRLPFVRPLIFATPALTGAELAAKVLAAVPDVSVVCMPAAIGGHPDHLAVRSMVPALQAHGISVRLYADLPYCIRFGWPEWITSGTPSDQDEVGAFWAADVNGMAEYGARFTEAQVLPLTAEEQAAKHEAVRRYATQYDALNAGRTKGRLEDDGIFAYEVAWTLAP